MVTLLVYLVNPEGKLVLPTFPGTDLEPLFSVSEGCFYLTFTTKPRQLSALVPVYSGKLTTQKVVIMFILSHPASHPVPAGLFTVGDVTYCAKSVRLLEQVFQVTLTFDSWEKMAEVYDDFMARTSCSGM